MLGYPRVRKQAAGAEAVRQQHALPAETIGLMAARPGIRAVEPAGAATPLRDRRLTGQQMAPGLRQAPPLHHHCSHRCRHGQHKHSSIFKLESLHSLCISRCRRLHQSTARMARVASFGNTTVSTPVTKALPMVITSGQLHCSTPTTWTLTNG